MFEEEVVGDMLKQAEKAAEEEWENRKQDQHKGVSI
jgi:hypothetical protein